MVNAFNDVDYTDETYVYSALWAINEVRKNADMPLLTSMGKEEFLERLYNEWRVEFAFEDHRFWDVRRWKIADTTQRELYGVKIEKQHFIYGYQFHDFLAPFDYGFLHNRSCAFCDSHRSMVISQG